jgi:NTP pyrophosphatase (non-canonical NTP hydrolase)
MTPTEKTTLYKAVIKKYGAHPQLDMAMEESAELIQAINKFKRKPTKETIHNLCSEIADVEIMLEQLRLMLNKDLLIYNIKEEKLNRLEQRVELVVHN